MDSYPLLTLPEQECCIDHIGKQLIYSMQPDHCPTAKESNSQKLQPNVFVSLYRKDLSWQIPSSVSLRQVALNLNVSWL